MKCLSFWHYNGSKCIGRRCTAKNPCVECLLHSTLHCYGWKCWKATFKIKDLLYPLSQTAGNAFEIKMLSNSLFPPSFTKNMLSYAIVLNMHSSPREYNPQCEHKPLSTDTKRCPKLRLHFPELANSSMLMFS
jgi:hypothetical protein